MNTPNYAGQGAMFFAPQISNKRRQFPSYDGLSAKWDTDAKYMALILNVLLGVHRDHYFAIILIPDGPEKPSNELSCITQNRKQQPQNLTICAPTIAHVGGRYLPRIFRCWKACKKVGVQQHLMAEIFRSNGRPHLSFPQMGGTSTL